MIIKWVIMIFVTFPLFAEDSSPPSGCKGDLTLIVTGLDSNEGQIKFDLDNNAGTFKPREGGPSAFMKGRSKIQEKRVEYVFKDIPCGEYAIKLYHDANMNEDLDKNFFKIPKEQYGFSNCKNCTLPPSWEKAKFQFDLKHPSITIDLLLKNPG